MKLPIIQAVRCSVCGTLHGINDHDYIVLWGAMLVNTNAKEPMDLGTAEKPTILCQKIMCLQRQFRLIDEATYKSILENTRKHYDDEEFEE